jgi:hypothetical protein
MVARTAVLFVLGDVSAQSLNTSADQNVSGTWTLLAEGYVMPMTLRQKGTHLSGTLQGTHRPFPLLGEFRKSRIHFAGTSDGGGIRHDDNRTRSTSRRSAGCNLTDLLLALW